jgi:hypothetical protein
MEEIVKLEQLRALELLELPAELFADVPRRVLGLKLEKGPLAAACPQTRGWGGQTPRSACRPQAGRAENLR